LVVSHNDDDHGIDVDGPKGRKWFDCAECHYEQESHPLRQQYEMVGDRPALMGFPMLLEVAPLIMLSTVICPKKNRRLLARNARSASGKMLRTMMRGGKRRRILSRKRPP
jgi:uncharacterized CHY-type Zn-finger protein